jgi:tetratricopeptide (TPR) repeat protein
MLETCLELRRLLGDTLEIAGTLSTLALTRLHAGDPAAALLAETEALQIFRRLSNRLGEMWGLLHLGQIALYEGDGQRARLDLEQARCISRELTHREGEAESELLLGEVAFSSGDYDEAAARFTTSLVVCRSARDRNGEANAERWLGKVDRQRGDLPSARRRLGESLQAFEAFGMRDELVACLEDHALLMHREGRLRDAAQLAAAVAQARVRLALVRPPPQQNLWDEFGARLRGDVGKAEFEAAWQRGQRWETKDALHTALAPVAATEETALES